MKVAVQFTPENEINAIPIILDRLPGMILPGRVYLLEHEVIRELRAAGIAFTELGRESVVPPIEGACVGERI